MSHDNILNKNDRNPGELHLTAKKPNNGTNEIYNT